MIRQPTIRTVTLTTNRQGELQYTVHITDVWQWDSTFAKTICNVTSEVAMSHREMLKFKDKMLLFKGKMLSLVNKMFPFERNILLQVNKLSSLKAKTISFDGKMLSLKDKMLPLVGQIIHKFKIH